MTMSLRRTTKVQWCAARRLPQPDAPAGRSLWTTLPKEDRMREVRDRARSLAGGGASLAFLWMVFGPVSLALGQTDPLPSWNDGPSKQAIVKFVDAVTTQGGPQFVAPPARIAVFDNDGTL